MNLLSIFPELFSIVFPLWHDTSARILFRIRAFFLSFPLCVVSFRVCIGQQHHLIVELPLVGSYISSKCNLRFCMPQNNRKTFDFSTVIDHTRRKCMPKHVRCYMPDICYGRDTLTNMPQVILIKWLLSAKYVLLLTCSFFPRMKMNKNNHHFGNNRHFPYTGLCFTLVDFKYSSGLIPIFPTKKSKLSGSQTCQQISSQNEFIFERQLMRRPFKSFLLLPG